MSGLLPAAIVAILDTAAARHSLPPALLRAVAWVESRGSATAVSPAGAMGVLQLMPRTAAGLGVADPFDPAQNIEGGAKYLKNLIDRFDGDTGKALAGYNWGPSRVARGSTWPTGVQTYVRRVGERMAIEDAALASETTQPRIVLDDGSGAADDPLPEPAEPAELAELAESTEPPLACYPPPHCLSCTCSPLRAEGAEDDT